MKKILLLSHPFMWYSEAYKEALVDLGYEVKLHEVNLKLKNHNYILRVLRKLKLLDVKSLYFKNRTKHEKTMIDLFDKLQPDGVIAIFGDQLSENTVRLIKKKCPVSLVLTDPLSHYYELEMILAYDYIYTFIVEDYELLKSLNANVHLVYGSYSPAQYFPMHVKRDVDIAFVGALYNEREVLLERLIEDYPNLKLQFWVRYLSASSIKKYFQWAFTRKRIIYKMFIQDYKKVNILYNQSKICLNIQGDRISSGWSSRLAEIAGTQSYQIINYNPQVDAQFKGMIDNFRNYEELKLLIDKALENSKESEKKASLSYKTVNNQFTYKNRLSKILRDMNL